MVAGACPCAFLQRFIQRRAGGYVLSRLNGQGKGRVEHGLLPTATLSLAAGSEQLCWGEKYTTSRKAESSQPMVFLSRVGGFRMENASF